MTDPFRPPPPQIPIPPPDAAGGSPRRSPIWPWLAGGAAFVLVAIIVLAVVLVGTSGTPDSETAANPSASGAATTPSTTSSAQSGSSPQPESSTPPSSAPLSRTASPQLVTAWTQLQTLPVKGRAPKTGYSREQFGQSWTDDVNVDDGHNGCDTRNDILRRDLDDVVLKPGTNGCVVASGTLHDPYTGTSVPFIRGTTTSSEVQIDHVVALADAWQKGAQQLTPERRADFANDPRNLQATIGRVNQQKSAGDAATWLPPDTAYRCTYAARQIEVKAAYDLWVTAAERDALERILRGCGVGD
ncbi:MULTISPECIES: HNH endonuclease family protein [Gordonia]|jgi:hypothetical protein|uniref:HNH endonuclease family protein n=1 Tax=Gordonia TaxID=2053 RepID=UPI0032B5BB0B